MRLTTQQKESIFKSLTERYGFVRSGLVDVLYVSPTSGALLYWDGNLMELTFGLCQKFEEGKIVMR